MMDEDNTKGELLNELKELRQKLAELKASKTRYEQTEEAISERKRMEEVFLERENCVPSLLRSLIVYT